MQLRKDMMNMCLGGAETDHQLIGNLVVGKTTRNESDDFCFPSTQNVQGRCTRGYLLPAGRELLLFRFNNSEQFTGIFRFDPLRNGLFE
jgi:hypothetical protein